MDQGSENLVGIKLFGPREFWTVKNPAKNFPKDFLHQKVKQQKCNSPKSHLYNGQESLVQQSAEQIFDLASGQIGKFS